MATPIIDALQNRLDANHPLAGAIVDGLRNAAQRTDTAIAPADVPAVAAEVAASIQSDPVALNNANGEPPSQSRVVTGSVQATIAALGAFLTGLASILGGFGVSGQHGIGLAMSIVMVVFGGTSGTGSVYALVGRLRNDLPPMSYRWYWPLSWLSKRPA